MKNIQQGFAFLPIIIIIAAIVAVGGGAYIYNQSSVGDKCVGHKCTSVENDSTQTDTVKPVVTDKNTSNGLSTNVALYTDANFGYKFYYPKTWKLTSTENTVSLTNFGPSYGDGITFKEVTGAQIKNEDAKFGTIIYVYDAQSSAWMVNLDGTDYYNPQAPGLHKANAVFFTASGMAVFNGVGRWRTYIIPLSPTKFLVANITGGGFTAVLSPIVKTISLSSDVNVSSALIQSLITEAIKLEHGNSTSSEVKEIKTDKPVEVLILDETTNLPITNRTVDFINRPSCDAGHCPSESLFKGKSDTQGKIYVKPNIITLYREQKNDYTNIPNNIIIDGTDYFVGSIKSITATDSKVEMVVTFRKK